MAQNFNTERIIQLTEAFLKLEHDETLASASPEQLHDALGRTIMMNLSESWGEAKARRAGGRHAYYISAEYLIGRLVYSNLFNLGILDEVRAAFAAKGVDLACMEDIEDAALGNGGLGRLAACYMDSAATCGVSLTGYGLRYRFGLFKQRFENGEQVEEADDWTKYGDPWSVRRYKHTVRVVFPDHTVLAVPYDTPVIGYKNGNISTLRLWQCEPEEAFDYRAFNDQDYQRALNEKNKAEDITRVLYPNDSTWEGKRLRLKQQYVMCTASLQDILRAFRRNHGEDWDTLPDYAAIQLNDTHPAMSIPELMRLLMAEGVDFDRAFNISQRVFSYTNHTVMSEALEKWDMELLASVVPDICDILRRLDEKLRAEHSNLYIINGSTVHMANLSVYGSHHVNGVAQIHSEIIKRDLFADFSAVWPEHFTNVTNGITPRRWLGLSNPGLTALLREKLGGDFLADLSSLERLKPLIDDETAARFNEIKLENKRTLCEEIKKREGIELNPEFVFDVQVKRLHEYKRQLMNAFSVMDIYFGIKSGRLQGFNPTVFIFGAKAAPGYKRAKSIIRYINRVAALINSDPDVAGLMKVVFVQDYNCSYAEKIIPAADISEQISPAGTEASGTGNMKFMVNGAVTLGTLDGANVEIAAATGRENNYIFGATVEEINRIKDCYHARGLYDSDERVRRVVDTLIDGTVPSDDGLSELYSSLLEGADWHRADQYYVLYDFRSYAEARERANADWGDRIGFAKKCLNNISAAGRFSSDRAITDYAEKIWGL